MSVKHHVRTISPASEATENPYKSFFTMKYLRNSAEIREELVTLFSGPEEKWAIVAFVGYNALEYLPRNTNNLQVICWPKAGGTHPDGVRRLIDKGIPVYFCNRLHQKIYWRTGAGLIVGSANLSDNALGDGGLHEFAIYNDDIDFDIRTVLGGLQYKAVTEEALANLDVEHAIESRRKSASGARHCARIPTFLESLDTKMRKRWKIVTWMEKRESNKEIQAEVEPLFGTRNWVNDNDIETDSYQVGDFVLQIHTDENGIIQRANARWMLVDHVIRKRSMNAIVQVNKLDERTPVPFDLDKDFKKNLKQAFNNEDSYKGIYDKNRVVQAAFLRKIQRLYTSPI